MSKRKPHAPIVNMTLIQQHASSVISTLQQQAGAVSKLSHRLTKGRFREIFIQTVLEQYLCPQFGVGNGIVVNQMGDQSSEHDVIVFDRRILPPFIASGTLGVFPVESVLATIEMKSKLTSKYVRDAEEAAKRLRTIHLEGSHYPEWRKVSPPLSTVVGYSGRTDDFDPRKENDIGSIKTLFGICVVGKFSWLKVEKGGGWRPCCKEEYDQEPKLLPNQFEETKRFIAVLVDNVRTLAERRLKFLERHRDWMTIYTRWDCAGARELRDRQAANAPGATGDFA